MTVTNATRTRQSLFPIRQPAALSQALPPPRLAPVILEVIFYRPLRTVHLALIEDEIAYSSPYR
jgi:hypothetical protein